MYNLAVCEQRGAAAGDFIPVFVLTDGVDIKHLAADSPSLRGVFVFHGGVPLVEVEVCVYWPKEDIGVQLVHGENVLIVPKVAAQSDGNRLAH